MLYIKKISLSIGLILFGSIVTFSQNTNANNDLIEKIIENIAEQSDEELDYSNLLEEMNMLITNPISLNTADEKELKKLFILNQNQIASFIKYREGTGTIFSLYELQLIPGFSEELIRMIKPFISVTQNAEREFDSKPKAQHKLLLKTEKTLEEEKAYTSTNPNSKFLGSPWKYYTRYQYLSPKKKMTFGFTSEKDKGEPFFKGENSSGFDYYSGFFQYKLKGIIKQINIGDYQVKFGQGLNLWSGLSSGKSSLTTQNANKSQGIKSYKSTNENQFFRGASLLLTPIKNSELAVFASYLNKDASLNSDSIETSVSSIVNTGFHRNLNEFDKKHQLNERVLGSYFYLNLKKVELGISYLQSEYSLQILPENKAYNQYRFKGTKNQNISLTYQTQYQSIHLFGEVAQSKSGGRAFIQGANIQAHSRLNLELIYRKYDPDYHAFFSSAFSEQSSNQNEEGFYFGAEFHPIPKWTIKAYYDQFQFPWLKYTANAPSNGHEYFSQLEFTPNSSTSIYFRYKQENKPVNNSSEIIKGLTIQKKNQYRLHLSTRLDDNWEIRNRIEIAQYKKAGSKESGYLLYQDIRYQFSEKPISMNLRFALFDTDSFNSRIYAYENDILYAYSVPAYYLQGSRFYFNFNWKINRNCKIYLKYAQTKYANLTKIGSGNSEIDGNKKSEIKLLLKLRL